MKKAEAGQDDMVSCQISCKCHGADPSCSGAIAINFPVMMFGRDGDGEASNQRRNFVRDILSVYDHWYEQVRLELMNRDAKTKRPRRTSENCILVEAHADSKSTLRAKVVPIRRKKR